MPVWTKMQQAAIDQRQADILVSAAAGSGKTAVLTERVLQRLIGNEEEDPIEIDRFLIVTFTSAAAQEMKERIMQKIVGQMNELSHTLGEENAKLDYLEKQIALVPRASISTIHAFCLKLMRSYFNQLEIDPNVKVGNEGELAMLRSEILEDLMETYLEQEDTEFMLLAETYGSVQGLENLKALILEINTFSKSTPFPEIWLKNQVEKLKQPYQSIDEMPWAEQFKQQIKSTIEDLEKIYKKALELCQLPQGPTLYEDIIRSDQIAIGEVATATSLSQMIETMKAIKFIMLPRKKQECDPHLKERVKQYRDLGKEMIKKLQEDLEFVGDKRLLDQLPYVGNLMESLVKVIADFEVLYTEKKQESSIVDYNDLEHYALKLLIEPTFDEKGELVTLTYTEVAKELSRFYKEIYIDEYQDSNTVQETILKAIAEADQEKGPTRFMVGDMKQSIYRFRLANPLIFAEKYQNWEKHQGEQPSKEDQVCIDLSQNFRSRANILEGVNDLFKQVMSPEVGELTYDDHAQLYVGNHYEEGEIEGLPAGSLSDKIELHLLETAESENVEEEGLENLKNVEWEAMMTANLIDKLLRGEGNPTHIFDKALGTYRKVQAKDIVILLRATKEKAGIFENALTSQGIGAYAEMSHSFFDAMEIQIMMSLLKIIDNPLQDIPLITVLRSPIVGLTYDEMVYIRESQKEGCFYEALQSYKQHNKNQGIIKAFLKQLEDYRNESSQLKLEELISKLYVETGYYRYVAMLPTGMKKKANLDLLRKYAAEYEANKQGKLFGFLQYLDKLSQIPDGLKEAKIVEGHEDLVRIMSIHKSKGLEFSIVFLCDTGKSFNNRDLTKEVLMHSELGLAPGYIDTKHYVKYPTLPKLAVKEQIKAENTSEEMRVLYVALTRAKEKLFITGTVSDVAERAAKWGLFANRKEKAIMALGVKKGQSYLNWIGMSLYAHCHVDFFRKLNQEEQLVPFQGESEWQVKVWHKEELGVIQRDRGQLIKDKKEEILSWNTSITYSCHKKEIIDKLSYQYPYKAAITMPHKVSVSEIKELKHQDKEMAYNLEAPRKIEQEAYVPKFMRAEKTVTGARRGTLIHSVFEHLDYLKWTTEEEIKLEIERMVKENILETEVLEVISYRQLAQMAQSDIVNKMRKATYVEKEKAFIYLANANQIDEKYPSDEKILVQGVIDSFFIDEEGITLIDYKTDYIDRNNLLHSKEQIRKKYQKQLEIYSKALSEITKFSVAHQYIYLYNINEWMHL